MTTVSLPEGCPHIEWEWGHNPDPSGAPPLLTQFATWTSAPGDDPEELVLRLRELDAQGLAMAASPHLCQTDPDSGRELWAVPVAAALI